MRLIDADALEKRFEEECEGECPICIYSNEGFPCGLIKTAPTVERLTGRWIPVSERLPEINKEVIVTDIETSDTYQSRYIGGGYWGCDNGPLNDRIIAWMPLPTPYKKESE
jgi:hypothetical protein